MSWHEEEIAQNEKLIPRKFRREAVYPKVVAALTLLGGRTAATGFLMTFPPRNSEVKYLCALGIPQHVPGRMRLVFLYQGLAFWFGGGALVFSLAVGWTLAQDRLWPSAAQSTITLNVLWLPAFFAVYAVAFGFPGFSLRSRLLVSTFRSVRLVRALSPNPIPGPNQLTDEWLEGERLPGTHRRDEIFERLLLDPRHRRRVVAGLAWALTRDTARLSGRSTAEGSTAGEVLLWFADNPADPRRRPIVVAYLGELVSAVTDHQRIPHAQFAAASRFRNRSPRERVLRQVRTFLGGALFTGVLVAIVTAAGRLWTK